MLPRHNSEEQLLENGWMKCNDKIVLKLHDATDPLYSFPRDIVKGCSCRKKCGKMCLCNKNRVKCTQQTCRFCLCMASEEAEVNIEDNPQERAEGSIEANQHEEGKPSETDSESDQSSSGESDLIDVVFEIGDSGDSD